MFRAFYEKLIAVGRGLQPLLLLGLRLFFGWQFFITGFGKLQDISGTAQFFQSLHFPLPTVQAYFAATVEALGGLMLLVGLGSRLAALLLSIVMLTALATAHHEAFAKIFSEPLNFIVQLPFPFLLGSLVVFAFGPGPLSIDALFKRNK